MPTPYVTNIGLLKTNVGDETNSRLYFRMSYIKSPYHPKHKGVYGHKIYLKKKEKMETNETIIQI